MELFKEAAVSFIISNVDLKSCVMLDVLLRNLFFQFVGIKLVRVFKPLMVFQVAPPPFDVPLADNTVAWQCLWFSTLISLYLLNLHL